MKGVAEPGAGVAPRVRLVYDSVRMQRSFGRPCPPGEDRSLLFRAGDLSLDLLVYGGHALQGVHGQLADEERGVPLAGVTVRMGGHVAETDAHGQFSLAATPDGSPLRVRTDRGEIRFPLPAPDLALAV